MQFATSTQITDITYENRNENINSIFHKMSCFGHVLLTSFMSIKVSESKAKQNSLIAGTIRTHFFKNVIIGLTNANADLAVAIQEAESPHLQSSEP